jgi:hypothetical protein
MFVETKVNYSALFTNFAGWHADALIFPLSDVILAQLACLLSDIMLCLHSGITNLSLYKQWKKGNKNEINNNKRSAREASRWLSGSPPRTPFKLYQRVCSCSMLDSFPDSTTIYSI